MSITARRATDNARTGRSERLPAARIGAVVVAAALGLLVAACVPPAPPTPTTTTTTRPPFPTTGRFVTEQYTDSQLTPVLNQTYGSAVAYNGSTVQLALDLYMPPTGGPANRPLVVVVHGGSFSGGNRQQMAGTARGYARRGFVAATISYRLDPGANDTPVKFLAAAGNAIDDGMESVRWLRANAATFKIDTTRMAMVGTSAGGAIALGVGAADDPTPGGPLVAQSPKIAAAVSTGATLTPGIAAGTVTFESTDAPSLMFHHAVDTVTGFTAAYSKQTCTGLAAAGAPCLFVTQPGAGHTVPIGAGETYWMSHISPHLWKHLRLATAV